MPATEHANAPMVIVGAGHCGGRAALALRERGWRGGIVLVGEEVHPPYERPALSKSLLSGATPFEALHLASADSWAEAAVDLRVNQSVTRIDREQRTLELQDGSSLAYHRLLLATGGSARRPPLFPWASSRVHSVRHYDDVQRLQPLLLSGQRVLIVGGGFIGLEVACTAVVMGCEVSLIEGANRLLERAVPASIAEAVTQLHARHGVQLSVGCFPESCTETAEGIRVTLQNGTCFDADQLIVGVGMQPRTELAATAGLVTEQGVVVDAYLRTSDPLIFAAGDVAQFPSPLTHKSLRQETWYNAQTQAQVAAANMLGEALAYDYTPWFWSDQYDHCLQVAGEPSAGVQRFQRKAAEGGMLEFYTDAQSRLVGFSGFGRDTLMARDFKLARKLVEGRCRVDGQALSDPGVALKSLLSAANPARPLT